MQKYIHLSKYSIGLVVLYVATVPFLIIFTKNFLSYSVFSKNQVFVVLVAIITLLASIFYLFWKFGKPSINFLNPLMAFCYGIVIAIPEEVLFRGLVQNYFDFYLDNSFIVILLSSLVYGLAHLPNEAKSLHPRGWNWDFAFMVFLVGLPLGTIFLITDSLFVPILLHTFLIVEMYIFRK